MALAPGARLGPYEIVAPLGVGGMGEVYRATDTNLKRAVAIKVLPDGLASDGERLARFQREAEVLASLNHPNIAQIYGLEGLEGPGGLDGQEGREKQEGRERKTIALVMELVDGPTLAAKLASAPGSEARGSRLPIEEALPIAKQIAEALEAAHEKGIIHRDLKPANVMVTHDGIVKVLDFGLAAIPQVSSPHGVDLTHSPTLTVAATRSGVILGTAAYMSPEQAAGKPVDKRADIWSFGVMVWEMLVGHHLFSGETISHTLADVLRADIDFGKLPSVTPPAIREILQRCLDRDTKSRLRDIGEARVAIQKYLANPAAGATRSDGATAPTARRRSVVAAWSVAALSAALAAAVALAHFRERPPEAEPVRFQLLPPGPGNFINSVTLSPDGRRFAFEFPGPDGRPMLWMRSMDSLEAHPVSGSEGAVAGPIWSPDNRFVVFATGGFTG
jgi:serine/threonine-protein kinase